MNIRKTNQGVWSSLAPSDLVWVTLRRVGSSLFGISKLVLTHSCLRCYKHQLSKPSKHSHHSICLALLAGSPLNTSIIGTYANEGLEQEVRSKKVSAQINIISNDDLTLYNIITVLNSPIKH